MKLTRLVPVLVTLCLLSGSLAASSASADPISELDFCSGVGRVMPLSDGSMIVPARCDIDQKEFNLFFKLSPDGTIDSSWADEGMLRQDGAAAVRADGSLVTFTDDTVSSFTKNGILDPAFSGSGVITSVYPFLGGRIRDAEVTPDGSIVLLSESNPSALARIDRTGELDASFGTDGIVEPPTRPGQTEPFGVIAIDDQGRILLGENATLLRLGLDGEPDATFGNGGFSVGDLGLDKSARPNSISFEDDGRIRYVTGPLVPSYTYCYSAYLMTFGASGNLIPEGVGNIGCGGQDYLPIGSNRVAVSRDYERGFGYSFGVTAFQTHGLGAPLSQVWNQLEGDIAPGQGSAGTLAYLPATGRIVANGFVEGDRCLPSPNYCLYETSLLVAMLDADTGKIDENFGDQGFVTIPGNECSTREVPDPDHLTAWQRCALPLPRFSGRAEVRNRRNPILVAHLNFSERIQAELSGSDLTVEFRLPSYMRPRSAKSIRRRGHIRAGYEGRVLFDAVGRTIRLRFKTPKLDIYDAFPLQFPLRAKLKIGRGAFLPIRRGATTTKSVGLGLTTIPTGPKTAWFDPSSGSKTLKFRFARAR